MLLITLATLIAACSSAAMSFRYSRAKARSALRESRATLRILQQAIENSAMGITMAGPDGTIRFTNSAEARMHGYTVDEIIGRSVRMLAPPLDTPRALDRELRQSWKRETRNLRKDGTVFEVEIVSEAVRGPEGELLGIVSCCQDITERKRVEAELRQSNAELEARVEERTSAIARTNAELQHFALAISHDLQEPLRTIVGFTDLLKRRYAAQIDHEAEEFIAYTVEAAKRAQNLVHDLLEYATVDLGSSPLAPTDASEALNRACDNLKFAIDETGAQVTYGALPKVLANSNQLIQLFQNLIGNALKYRGPAAPRIEVSAASQAGPNEAVAFRVQDNGLGFDQSYAPRMFAPFKRFHGRKYPGNGIGLAICKKIVERHHGRIWATAEVGKGACFFFTLPRAVAESTTRKKAA